MGGLPSSNPMVNTYNFVVKLHQAHFAVVVDDEDPLDHDLPVVTRYSGSSYSYFFLKNASFLNFKMAFDTFTIDTL